MSAPATPEGVDPAVELAGRYVCTIEAFDRRTGHRDEEVEAFDADCRTPMERELTKVVPTTRRGVLALLDLVLREERENIAGGGDPGWTALYIIGLLENVRQAVETGPISSDLSDPTFSQRLRDWQRLNAEFPEASEQRQDQIGDQMSAIERQMTDTPARTIPNLLVKLRLAGAVIKTLKADIAEGKLIEERLLMSALGDLEDMERLAKAGKPIGPGINDAPDPVIELAERWRRVMTEWFAKPGTSTVASEKADDNQEALEDALAMARPTTREGAATLLDAALKAIEWDIPGLGDKLIENARDAVREGVA